MLIKVLKNYVDRLIDDFPYKDLKVGDEIELDILSFADDSKENYPPIYIFTNGYLKFLSIDEKDKINWDILKTYLRKCVRYSLFSIVYNEIKKNKINTRQAINTEEIYNKAEKELKNIYAEQLEDSMGKEVNNFLFALKQNPEFLNDLIPRIINDITEEINKLKQENKELKQELKKEKITQQQRLFNNEIDTERAFGMSRAFSDSLNKLTNKITPKTAEENFKYSRNIFKYDEDLALKVIDTDNQIQTAEQFYKALERIKSGKVLQTLLALWYYANNQGNFIFSGTRLNKVMQTLLKTKTGNYTQEQKRAFTEAIHRLSDFEIWLDQTITDTDDKGRKQKVIKRDFYKLIDLVGATYAKRKKDVIDPATGRVIRAKGTADESVIIKLYGELLPRFNKGIMRGRLYSRGLLELDANKDERAILLGFKLLTRFDQLRQGAKGKDLVSDNNLYIKTDRKTLIEWADYKQTDEVNKGVANQHLIKTLNKLIEINCLRDYEPKKLTTDDDFKITLYPSAIALKPPAKDDQTLKIEAPKPEEKEKKGQTKNWSNLPVEKQKKEFKKYLVSKGKNEKTANKMTENKFKNGFCF